MVERRTRRVEPGRPRIPEPMGLGMSHLSEDHDRHSHCPRPPLVIDELFQRLMTLSNQLESAIKLSSSVQAHHATAQNIISTLESEVVSLETHQISGDSCGASTSRTRTHIVSHTNAVQLGKVSRGAVQKWASECERLAFAHEWEDKVKTVEMNLGTTTAKCESGLASLGLVAASSSRLSCCSKTTIEFWE